MGAPFHSNPLARTHRIRAASSAKENYWRKISSETKEAVFI